MSNEALNAAVTIWPGEDWTLDEAAGECGRVAQVLVPLVRSLRVRALWELERRRRSPGGQQAGPNRWAMVPASVLQEIERDCRFALEACDVPLDDPRP